jgi:hypothetical protein
MKYRHGCHTFTKMAPKKSVLINLKPQCPSEGVANHTPASLNPWIPTGGCVCLQPDPVMKEVSFYDLYDTANYKSFGLTRLLRTSITLAGWPRSQCHQQQELLRLYRRLGSIQLYCQREAANVFLLQVRCHIVDQHVELCPNGKVSCWTPLDLSV